MKTNRNFTPYWIVLLGALMTVPAAFIIMDRLDGQPALPKAVLITVIFFVLTGAITLLYRHFFNVTMNEITQDKKVTELDKKRYWLQAYGRKRPPASNSQKRLFGNVHRVNQQLESFQRRREVFYSLFDGYPAEEGGALKDLAALVEEALDFNTDKIIDRIKIFDDRLPLAIVQQNMEYIEDYAGKNDQVLADFEKLIMEVSGLNDSSREVDVSKLTDMIQAMESLRTKEDKELDNLRKKYE